TCDALGQSYGPCVGEVMPQPEICGNGVDDDCDGNSALCAGGLIWSKILGDSVDDEGTCITVDPSDNVILGSYGTLNPDFGCGALTIGPNYHAVMAKYSA